MHLPALERPYNSDQPIYMAVIRVPTAYLFKAFDVGIFDRTLNSYPHQLCRPDRHNERSLALYSIALCSDKQFDKCR